MVIMCKFNHIVYRCTLTIIRNTGLSYIQLNTVFSPVLVCIDFNKAYDSVRREVLYNIFIEFGIPMKLVRLIKMCLTETYSRVQVGKNLSDMFPTSNGLKQDALLPLLFNITLEYAIRTVHQDGLKLNSTHQHLVYADVNILGVSVHTIKENAETLVVASKEIELEVNADKSKYMVMS